MAAAWRLETSRRSGAQYYYNAATGKSLWHDAALPVGWAWGRDSEGAPKYYVHLESGLRTDVPPPVAPPQSQAPLPPTAAQHSQLSFAASQAAGDDLASQAYIPDTGVRGDNVPWKIRQKRDRLFASVPEHLRWALHVDEVSLYSVTEATIAEEMTRILLGAAGSGAGIVDANACVGGNTLSFARAAFRHVSSVELSEQRARMLRHNADLCGLSERVAVFQGDFLSLLAAALQLQRAAEAAGGCTPPTLLLPRAAATAAVAGEQPRPPPLLTQLLQDSDVVFFDPPWGGPEYWREAKLDMFLGTVDVADVVTALTFAAPPAGATTAAATTTATPLARVVAIKAPLNYNVEGLRAKLRACGSGAELRDDETRAWAKMQLLIVRSAAAPGGVAPLPRSHPLYATLAPLAPRATALAPGAAPGTGAAVAGVKRRAGASESSSENRQHVCGAADAAATAAAASLRQRWASREGTAHAAFELLLPESQAKAAVAGIASVHCPVVASGWFLHADTSTGTVALRSVPQFLAVSCAQSSSGSEAVRLHISGGSHVICAESASLHCLCEAATNPRGTSSLLVRCVNYEDTAAGGLQFLTLAADSGVGAQKADLCMQPVATGAAVSSSALSFRSVGEVGEHACELRAWAASAGVVQDGSRDGIWLPCMFRPVFQGTSLTDDGVFGSATVATAASAVFAAPPLGAYAALGVIPGWTEPAVLAGGVRSQVKQFTLLHAADQGAPSDPRETGAESTEVKYVVKEQEWDGRVAEEIAALDACSASTAVAPGAEATAFCTGVIRPYAHFRDERRSFLIMPHCGASLKDWATRGQLPELLARLSSSAASAGATGTLKSAEQSPAPAPFAPWRAAKELLTRLLVGIRELHARGLLFRDLHPGNVCCKAAGGGVETTLIDLGSAVRVTITASGGAGAYHGKTRGGRWDFMPAEQFGTGRWADGGEVTLTPASDIFAAAATVLYAISGGEAPFGVPAGSKLSVESTLTRHPRRKAAALEAHVAAVLRGGAGGDGGDDDAASARVQSVLLRCLKTDAAARFQTASEALEALGLLRAPPH